MIKKALLFLFLGLVALSAILLFNTFRFRSKQVQVEPVTALAVDKGDSVKSVLDHVTRTVDDPRVAVSLYGDTTTEPSTVSSVDTAGYKVIERTVRQLFPGTIVAPSQVLGGTDSRHYSSVSSNIYRFVPEVVGPDDLKRVHGTNERISIENLAQIVRFYHQLILNSAQ